ncbi:MAG TPA: hypothetical protein VKU39_15245 [Streptosporangiaceae bacterium]|nr:hypothetical protein [Streptosporangiaceae bacterium]
MVHDTDSTTELRFSVSGWRCYHVGVLAIMVGVTSAACAGEALALWGGAAFRIGVADELLLGCLSVALAVTTLVALLANLWEAARTWLRWRQLRQPAAVVSRDGIRYQPRGCEVAFAWADIEEVALHQYHHGRRAAASVDLRLAAPACTRTGRRVRVPADRTLTVGNLDQIDVPAPTAIATLRRLAGPRFALR